MTASDLSWHCLSANSFLKGQEIAQEFGFPLVIRASYTLGGAGASFVHKAEEFDELCFLKE